MKLFEDMNALGGSINDVIKKIINDLFNEDLDDDQVAEISMNLSLSDMLALDKAYTDGDAGAIKDIIGPLPTMEYSMGQNRASTSTASSRPAPGRVAQGQQMQKKPGTQNTVNTNRNYSDGIKNGVTTQRDDKPDQATMAQDEEQVEETNVQETTKFSYGDPIIDDQGRTGQIDGRTDENGYVMVAFYDNIPKEKMHVSQLEINDYADSEKEEEDLRLAMGDDEYDRIHGDLGYNDDDEDMYETKVNVVNQINAESAMRNLADKYQAIMAGMDDGDENEVLDMMQHIEQKYGISMDDYLDAPYESKEQNVVDMVEWLKRRAGLA